VLDLPGAAGVPPLFLQIVPRRHETSVTGHPDCFLPMDRI